MRSTIHGTFATLMLLVPVGAIPALAIFGIPQFAPVVASPLHEGDDKDRERRVGESARGPADDLFQDEEDFPPRNEEMAAAPGRLGDAVPVPNRNLDRDVLKNEEPAPLNPAPRQPPSWADDLAETEPLPPKRSPKPDQRGNSRSGGLQADSAPRPGANDRDRGNKLPPGFGSVEPEDLGGYRRQRESLPERTPPARREESERVNLTWQDAVRRLNDLEIRNFRLEPSRQANQFVFICSYTPSDSPRVSYRFEAESDEPLKAVEKVLAQIDEWQEQRK